MQRLLEIPQEVYDFLRNFRLRAGDLNRDSPGCLLLPLRGNSPCGGSKTAPFTHPLPGVPAPLAGISILQQTHLCAVGESCLLFSREINAIYLTAFTRRSAINILWLTLQQK